MKIRSGSSICISILTLAACLCWSFSSQAASYTYGYYGTYTEGNLAGQPFRGHFYYEEGQFLGIDVITPLYSASVNGTDGTVETHMYVGTIGAEWSTTETHSDGGQVSLYYWIGYYAEYADIWLNLDFADMNPLEGKEGLPFNSLLHSDFSLYYRTPISGSEGYDWCVSTGSGPANVVPIPGTLALLGSGLLCLGAMGRKKSRTK